MKIEELNPFIRYASMHQTYYPQKENSVCYDCRLFYVVKGDGTFFANNQKYHVSQGFSAFLPPETSAARLSPIIMTSSGFKFPAFLRQYS